MLCVVSQNAKAFQGSFEVNSNTAEVLTTDLADLRRFFGVLLSGSD
jgi:hypothetical protein